MGDIRVVQIPPEHVFEVLARPLAGGGTIEDALYRIQERTNGEVMVGRFLDEAEATKEQLWVVWDGEALLAAVGTLLERTGIGSMQARIRFCTGEDSERWWQSVVDEVEAWARARGCERVLIFSRPGWSPRLRKAGYRVRHIEHVRELSHGR